MREAGDNEQIHGPTQPAAEHTAAESELPEAIRLQISYEARVTGVVEIDYDADDDVDDDALNERAYIAVETTYERPA